MTASYPTTVVPFTPKVDFTDVVLAAHVNRLQEEVVAIQTELGTDVAVGSGWVGDVDFATTNWDTLKDRIANIEYGLKDVYDDYVSLVGGSTIVSAANSTVSLTIKAKSGQTANLIEFKNSSNSVISNVNSSGNIFTYSQQVVPIVYSSTQPSSVPAGTIWVDSSSNVAQLNAQAGVPVGGTTGQALVKASNANYDLTWGSIATPTAETLGGTTLKSTITGSSLTSVGTLTNLTVTNTITGSINGNAATATVLQNARTINGVSFNGSANITVTAAAGTLTGTALASNVVSSSLTSVGTLDSLSVTNAVTAGSFVGDGSGLTNLVQNSEIAVYTLMGAWL